MFNTQEFIEKYGAQDHELTLGQKVVRYYLPRSIEQFIDTTDPMKGFPLWAKVWPASIVLADFMAALPVEDGKRTLEIGAGIGIAGIAAAAFGHDVVISECDPNALEFARAIAHLNGLADLPVICIDWADPAVAGPFDRIIGSEVVFRNDDLQPLQNLFQRLLKPGGEVVLSTEVRKPAIDFFQNLSASYDMKAQTRTLRSGADETKIVFCRMKSR